MQQQDRLQYLLEKTTTGTIAEEERQELFVLLTDPDTRQLYNDLFEQLSTQYAEEEDFFSAEETTHLFEQINEKNRESGSGPDVSTRIHRLKPVLFWAAACITMLLSLLSYRFFVNMHRVADQKKMAQLTPAPRPKSDVMLTLSDGTQVSLDSTVAGRVFEQKGARAVNNDNGTLTYAGDVTTAAKPEVVYNTLTIPRGKQYKVVLPDGSQVWLNAASSLHYPTQFPDQERKVELSGEAYFDIVKDDRKPFLVVTAQQTISVLGTSFNVKAYTDEPYIKTTLIAGSVKIDPLNGSKSRVLKPGEQAIVANNDLQVKTIDTKEDVSWRSDLFYFSDTDLREMAYQLQRWYDIEVDFSSLPAKRLYGQLPRSTPLPELLSAIEKTSNIKFKLSNGRLFVEK
ncbi:FecR family protein [Chitinophaga sp. RAB17]|uniref:FecR family protein n=1 Tax=Chitinophaga sp. RAB17 TaxID=3233049 RepID=UPI003F91AAF3